MIFLHVHLVSRRRVFLGEGLFKKGAHFHRSLLRLLFPFPFEWNTRRIHTNVLKWLQKFGWPDPFFFSKTDDARTVTVAPATMSLSVVLESNLAASKLKVFLNTFFSTEGGKVIADIVLVARLLMLSIQSPVLY